MWSAQGQFDCVFYRVYILRLSRWHTARRLEDYSFTVRYSNVFWFLYSSVYLFEKRKNEASAREDSKMRKWIALLLLVPGISFAAGSNHPLDDVNIDLTDKASLQNGAKIFMNYCLGCHQMQYQRYQKKKRTLAVYR